MEIQMPIPYLSNEGNIYKYIEIKKPSGQVLADARDAIDRTNEFNAMRVFVAGCTESIASENETITDSVAIKSMLGKISNKTLEYLSAMIMVDYYDGEDYIEGVYPCPRCGTSVVSEKSDADGVEIDTRDRITDLHVGFMEDIKDMQRTISFTPVELRSRKTVDEVSEVTLRMPTTNDYIKAFQQGGQNMIKIQFQVYGDCIIKANGVDVDDTWRRSYGYKLFATLTDFKKVFKEIGDWLNAYGLDPEVEKICRNQSCGKVFNAIINSSNFFASALQ